MILHSSSAPWLASLTRPEYFLTFYFLVVAGLALFAGFLRTLSTRNEVGSRYRTAVIARLSVTAVATISYILIVITFIRSYGLSGTTYHPNAGAVMTFALRYTDWSITVPLLTVELLAVCAVTGSAARRQQWMAITGAFLMIFSGFLGIFVVGDGSNQTQLLLWGGVSGVFWIFTNVVLIRCVSRSLGSLTTESALLLRNATILLLGGWVVYPLVFLIQIFGAGGAWATTMQVALCIADVVVKIGFGGLVHRVAKLRTAEDVRAGDDVHPESIWISSVKHSDAGAPREVYLADSALAHPPRAKPPISTAVPAPPPTSDVLGD